MNRRNRELFDYIVPSAGCLCVIYLYNIVDGIFIGRGVGPLALAAVNVTVPFITAVIAFSTLFAMGGSTVIAIRLGRGDKEGANDAFMTSLTLMFILSLLLLAAGTIFPRRIVIWSGSSTSLLSMAEEYMFYYTLFAIPFLLSNCLSIFVRNDGAPGLAFFGMIVGAVSNIFLDWLFIFPMQMGLKGAAVASGLGQVLAFFILASHFILKRGELRIRKFAFSWKLTEKVCIRGIPEFISQLNTPVTIFCYNWVLVKSMGDIGLASFSVLSFLYSIANAVLSGTAQGLQPLWGRAFGQNDKKELKSYLAAGLRINIISAAAIYLAMCLFRVRAVQIFSSDAALVRTASAALPAFAFSFIFMAVNFIYTAYFYSTKQTGKANLLALSRGMLIKAPAVVLGPVFLGSSFIWFAAAAAEGITSAITVIWERNERHRPQNRASA